MPSNSPKQDSERRATSSAQARAAQPQPTPAAGETRKGRTRSTVDPSASAPATQSDKYREARKTLSSLHLLAENAPCTPQTLASVLLLMAETCKMPENVARALTQLAELSQQLEAQCPSCISGKPLPQLIRDIQDDISAEFNKKWAELSQKIPATSPAQDQLDAAVKEIGQAAEHIKASVNDMGNSIAKVTDTSTQLASTASTYKDALINGNPQARASPTNRTQIDPRIARDVDRKSRQILIDTMDTKVTGASIAEIREKVSNALKTSTNPPPPQDITIEDISKTRKGGFTVLFKEKEVIAWLQGREAEFHFTSEIAPDAEIIKRSYSILVPRIPITFDPSNETHLREVEECNDLPPGAIAKARWIKPEYRRVQGQKAAHAIFALTDAAIANKCIRDGIQVCALRVRPNRLKHEPMQCMKCRRWGHFAHSCTAEADICGTCGEEHKTKECTNRDKTYCVSCKNHTHASWNRDCPEFRRRCIQFDENFPENDLPYFPTEEEWTMIPRPSKLPLPEKFPAKYSANQPPQLRQPLRTTPNTQDKQRKRKMAPIPENQSTLDQFVAHTNPQRAGNEEPDRANFGASPAPEGWD